MAIINEEGVERVFVPGDKLPSEFFIPFQFQFSVPIQIGLARLRQKTDY